MNTFKQFTTIFIILFCYSIATAQWVEIGSYISDTTYVLGTVVALNDSGNIIASSAEEGAVSVYQNHNNNWEQVGSTIVKHKFDDLNGCQLAINGPGNILAYNTPVQILKFEGLDWVQMGSTIDTSSLGYSLGINDTGNVLIASKVLQDYSMINKKSIFIYKYQDENWDLYGEKRSEYDTLTVEGRAVTINSDGTIFAASSGSIVQVFKLEDNKWQPFGDTIKSSGFLPGEELKLSDDGLTISTVNLEYPGWGGGLSSYIAVYEYTNGTWKQKGNDINYDGNIRITASMNAAGDVIACHSKTYSAEPLSNVKVYGFNGTDWEQRGQSFIGEGGKGPKDVSLNAEGNILAIGESEYADTINGVNGRVRVFKMCDTYNQIFVTEPDIYYMPDETEITKSGVYNDTVQNNAGCDSIISYNVTIENEISGLPDTDNPLIEIYPNPTKGIIVLKGGNLNSIENVQVISITGSEVDYKIYGNTIDLGTNSNGIYVIRFYLNDKLIMKKVILE